VQQHVPVTDSDGVFCIGIFCVQRLCVTRSRREGKRREIVSGKTYEYGEYGKILFCHDLMEEYVR